MQNPKIIFMGTPEFAVPAMEAVNEKFGLSAVVTVPDKPQGRGLKLIPSPVKAKAEELGLKIFLPQSLKEEDFIEAVREIGPDIIVVIAFRILPKELYTLPSIASFNIHGSLLPKYRGAAPINHAIINGESATGLTSFILQDKVDTGNILLTKETDILPGMTAGELHDKLMPMAAELSIETIDILLKGSYQTISQNDSLASPAPKLFKENTVIDWNMSSKRVINFIHGLSPHPAAWTIMDGAVLKILKAVEADSNSLEPGQFSLSKKEFLIGTATGDIKILQLQPTNKKSMPINDFLNGYRGALQGMMI